MNIAWAYMRKGWVSCTKAWTVFAEKNIVIDTEVDAKKQVFTGEDAWHVVAGADKIYVANGKNIIEFDPATAVKEQILSKITGRTGNLRAPTLKRGNVFYVGFNAALYDLLS